MSFAALGGGRTWWAHFEFTRINIEPIILKNKIEDSRHVGDLTLLAERHGQRSTRRDQLSAVNGGRRCPNPPPSGETYQSLEQ